MMNLINSRLSVLTPSHLRIGLGIVSLFALVLGGSAGSRWS